MSERASIFEENPDFDVSDFQPRKEGRGEGAPSEIVRAVSEASSFKSREPPSAVTSASNTRDVSKREPRRYRTGRNVQLNIKVRAETLESFYALADQRGWILGETFERAIAALSKDLAGAQ